MVNSVFGPGNIKPVTQPLEPMNSDELELNLEVNDIITQKTPSDSPKILHKPTKYDGTTPEKKLKNLEQAAKNLENEIEKVKKGIELLNKDITEDLGNQIGEGLVYSYQGGQTLNEVAALIAEQLEIFIELTPEEKQKLDEHSKVTGLLSNASTILEILQGSSILVQKEALILEKKALLDVKNKELQNLKPDSPEAKKLEQEIKLIHEDLQKDIYQTNQSRANIILQSGLILPDLSANIYAAVKLFGNIANNPIISSTIGMAGSIAGVAATGIDLVKATRAEVSHIKHTADLTVPSVSVNPKMDKELLPIALKKYREREIELQNKSDLTEKEKIELKELPEKIANLDMRKNKTGISNIKDVMEVTDAQLKIFTMYQQRKITFEARLAEEAKIFDEILTSNNDDFTKFKNALEDSGFSLKYSENVDGEIQTKEITSFRDLDVKGAKEKLLASNVDRKDTMSVMAKNQLRARFQASEEVNHKFFSFKRARSTAFFGVSIVTSIATISMATLTLAAVAFPPALLAIPAVLGVAATVGSIAIGLYHLHKHKPNIAKTIITLVKPRIMLNQLRVIYTEFNLLIEEIKQSFLDSKVEDFAKRWFDANSNGAQIKDKEKENFMIERDAAQAELDESVKYWNDRKAKYETKIADLENEIIEAKKRDYDKTGFKSFELDNPSRLEKFQKRFNELENKFIDSNSLTAKESTEYDELTRSINKIKNDKKWKGGKDDFYMLAEALIEGEFWKDPEAAEFIKKYGGVQLEKELKLHSETKDKDIEFLHSKLTGVILRDSSEILKWVEKQNIKEVQI